MENKQNTKRLKNAQGITTPGPTHPDFPPTSLLWGGRPGRGGHPWHDHPVAAIRRLLEGDKPLSPPSPANPSSPPLPPSRCLLPRSQSPSLLEFAMAVAAP